MSSYDEGDMSKWRFGTNGGNLGEDNFGKDIFQKYYFGGGR